MQKIDEMAKKLMALIDKQNFIGIKTHLSEVLRGKRNMPGNWENAILIVTETENRKDLLSKYPKIKFPWRRTGALKIEKSSGKKARNMMGKAKKETGKSTETLVLELIEILELKRFDSAYTTFSRIINGNRRASQKWENALLIVLECEDRKTLLRKFQLIQFPPKTMKAMAEDLSTMTGNQKVAAVYKKLQKILRGKRDVPKEWEDPLITATECDSKNELVAKYPAIRFSDFDRRSAITRLMTFLKNPKRHSISAALSTILSGKRAVPLSWETYFIISLQMRTKAEIREKFPAVKFASDK